MLFHEQSCQVVGNAAYILAVSYAAMSFAQVYTVVILRSMLGRRVFVEKVGFSKEKPLFVPTYIFC